jgi:hypothetical protein
MIGAVGVAAMAFAIAVRLRYRGKRVLREPTNDEARDIAEPLSSMLMRRARMSKKVPDIIDGLTAIAALGTYMNAGPLTRVTDHGSETPMPTIDGE